MLATAVNRRCWGRRSWQSWSSTSASSLTWLRPQRWEPDDNVPSVGETLKEALDYEACQSRRAASPTDSSDARRSSRQTRATCRSSFVAEPRSMDANRRPYRGSDRALSSSRHGSLRRGKPPEASRQTARSADEHLLL